MDKLLSDKRKARRRKRTEVNIKVTIIVWLLEVVGSIILMFSPKVFAHGQVGTATGVVFVILFYFVLLPCAYLINSDDIKKAIMEDGWFFAIRGIFNRTNVQVVPK